MECYGLHYYYYISNNHTIIDLICLVDILSNLRSQLENIQNSEACPHSEAAQSY